MESDLATSSSTLIPINLRIDIKVKIKFLISYHTCSIILGHEVLLIIPIIIYTFNCIEEKKSNVKNADRKRMEFDCSPLKTKKEKEVNKGKGNGINLVSSKAREEKRGNNH